MRVSIDWLADFVDVPDRAELCARLVAAGVEVEAVLGDGAGARDVVAAWVQAVRPHPRAPHLKICDVFDGQATYAVICGAPNVAADMRVAFVRPGGRIPGPAGAHAPRAIGVVMRRGVPSHGMLCSRHELGLPDEGEAVRPDEASDTAASPEQGSAGVWILEAPLPLGSDVFQAAADAAVLEVSVAANRPDLMCHLGIAREVAASTQRRTKAFKWRLTEKGPDVGQLGRVLVEDGASCRRYVARIVRGLKVGPSPDWLRRRLIRIGQRSINNVVDAVNYVMHELGQPLHAFDLSHLAAEAGCPTLRVRRAVPEEALRTLDGVVRTLTADDLVVADPTRAVALAGILGGADAEVRAGTREVLVEGAAFDPVRIRRAARRHGLRTEASQRFERGVDTAMVAKAVDRCAQLLAEVAGGEVAKGCLDVAQKPEPPRELPLRPARVARLLGVAPSTEALAQLLETLEIRCVQRTEAALIFEVPSHRPDITREVDLIEEVARRFGYDRIVERLPNAAQNYAYLAPAPRVQDTARAALLACGLDETVTHPFCSPTDGAAFVPPGVAPPLLQNPMGEQQRALRPTLWPGLLAVAQRNAQRGHKDARFFEVGHTFEMVAPEPLAVTEELHVACVISGARYPGRWYGGGEQVDASDLTGLVEALVDAFDLGAALTRHDVARPGLNPFCSAALRAGTSVLGYFGQIAPELLLGLNLGGPVYACEISLTALAALPSRRLRAHALPRYPKTRRDLALIVSPPKATVADGDAAASSRLPANVATLQAFIVKHAGGTMGPAVIERVWLFDRYVGAPLAAGEVSLAFAIDYRSHARTLQEQEVAEAFSALCQNIESTLHVRVRSA